MDPRVTKSAINRGYDPTLHRRRPINLGSEPTVTVKKADSAMHLCPSTVCIVDAKKCKQYTAPRTLCTRKISSHVAQGLRGLRTCRCLNTIFHTMLHLLQNIHKFHLLLPCRDDNPNPPNPRTARLFGRLTIQCPLTGYEPNAIDQPYRCYSYAPPMKERKFLLSVQFW